MSAINISEGSVLTYSDPSLIFVFLLLFSAATISLCFFLSTLFSRANVAAAAGGILYALTYMPYIFISRSFGQLSRGAKIASCLLSNVAMGVGCQILGQFEGKGSGIQWRTLSEGATVDDDFTLLDVFLLLIGDAIIYMVLALYIEGVRPGEYGLPKPWYFPCMKSFWFGGDKHKSLRQQSVDLEKQVNPTYDAAMDGANGDQSQEYFEVEPKTLEKIVEIKNLTKVFTSNGKTKIAVNNLCLNMYEGQVNVLLGHNGAGKTTTMSMLTGFFPPTSGEAYVMDNSITTEMAGVRKSLGLCPQFNILFDLLTVDEHLYFFGRLKGLSKKKSMQSARTMRGDLKLDEKAHAQSRTLSGGMKRKLSVGIALSAGSKYVILDEPTSGMDPAARRAIWDVIQQYRSKCSILLSTHFMDEADLLGDRIAIMAEGKLRCAGSPVFLKKKFGVGYHVVLTKTSDCDVTKLIEFFNSHVAESRLERKAGGEVSFLLPFQASSCFPELFRALEEKATSLGVTNFGATVTTMEEVFLKVTEDAETAVTAVGQNIISRHPTDANRSSVVSNKSGSLNHKAPSKANGNLHSLPKRNKGASLWFQQFYALVVKRLLHSRRNYKVAVAQILVPVAFGLLAILNAKFPPWEQKNVALYLSLDAYGPNTIYHATLNNSTFLDDLNKQFVKQFAGEGADEVVMEDKSGNLEKVLSDKYAEKGGDFNTRNLISASFSTNAAVNRSKSIAWFNDQAYHTAPMSLAYLDQAYLRMVTNRSALNVKIVNYPLPRTTTNRVQEQLIGSLSGFLIAFNLVLGFSFLAASFSLFLVRERVDRSSLLQTLAGVDPFCFWLSAFAWDFINFITPSLLNLVIFAIFSVEEFTAHWGVVLLLFVLYCWSSLPLVYLLSLLFSVPSSALVRITILNLVAGLASVITINVLRLLAAATPNLSDVANALDKVFLLLPQYCLGQGIADIYTNHRMVNTCTSNKVFELICAQQNITYQTNFLAWPEYGVGRFAVLLAIQGAVFFFILFVYEFHWFSTISHFLSRTITTFRGKKSSTVSGGELPIIDEDVQAEKDRINSTFLSDLVSTDRLVVKNIKKVYGRGQKSLVAVNNLCLGIPKGQCFGLLGINGAGKTTTFKMLTGDYKPTSGTAYVGGFNIRTHLRKVQQQMGYCPQFDGLIQQMTGTETLRMFARLRGVPESEITACIKDLATKLHFSQHMDKSCGTYSGGNKRKLSTAIALVGNPPVVLLDEPSTGMDPGARRMLWDALTDVRTSGCSIVITSHSMEECEALCTRLAIMVNGELRCLGGPQHLKSRFGQGYTIEIKVLDTAQSTEPVRDFVEENFPGSKLKEDNQGLINYHVPQEHSLPLYMVFELMERGKSTLEIKEYTVSQTTLEQVFLSLVRFQRSSETEDNDAGSGNNNLS